LKASLAIAVVGFIAFFGLAVSQQAVPSSLGAIPKALNNNPNPSKFIQCLGTSRFIYTVRQSLLFHTMLD